jgi:drug/metabolite transporter (DMT)-like permease
LAEVNIVYFGLLFGLIGTVQVHLAKALERQGIEIFSKEKSFKEKGKKPLIYIIGLALNNTIFIWQMLGTQYSTASVYSSMFGLGLIVLMLYSYFVLKEEISRRSALGIALIIFGTTLVGIIQILEPPTTEILLFSNFIILCVIIFIFFFILIIFFIRMKLAVSFIFGLVSGSMGAIDNVFKRIGLKAGFSEIFNLSTFPIFMLSFVIGLSALIITQFGFAKGADASKLVPISNSFYIITPIYFELIIILGASISIFKIFAIIIIIAGILLMDIYKRNTSVKDKE